MSETDSVRSVAFVQLEKFDATTNEFAGTMVSETPDESGEIFDYATSKPEVKKWTEAAKKRSHGKSLGNVREMHGLKAAGKLTEVTYDDTAKKIRVKGLVVDAETRLKIAEGVLTGLSIGGKYVKTWADPENPQHLRYTAGLNELSFVDSPCVEDATLELTTSDGKKVLKFSRAVPSIEIETADVDETDEDRVQARELGKASLERPKAKGPALIKRTATTATEDDMTPEQLSAALDKRDADRAAAKAAEKAAKLKKWTERATPLKVDYAALSKADRRVFRAKWRVNDALDGLQKVIGGSDAATARAIVGPINADDEGKVGPDGQNLSKASEGEIAQRMVARAREAL